MRLKSPIVLSKVYIYIYIFLRLFSVHPAHATKALVRAVSRKKTIVLEIGKVKATASRFASKRTLNFYRSSKLCATASRYQFHYKSVVTTSTDDTTRQHHHFTASRTLYRVVAAAAAKSCQCIALSASCVSPHILTMHRRVRLTWSRGKSHFNTI